MAKYSQIQGETSMVELPPELELLPKVKNAMLKIAEISVPGRKSIVIVAILDIGTC